MATLTKRVAEIEANLQVERVALKSEMEKAHKLAQALKEATALVSCKDEELERVAQTRTTMETELKITRTALAIAEAKVAEEVGVARAEAAEKEFGAGFFQGYSDLKRRVALVHPEWDLTAYLGVESYF